MSETKTFVFEYSQPRLHAHDATKIIWESKEQSFEARDIHDARKKVYRFINEGSVELGDTKVYRSYRKLYEAAVAREPAQLKPEFAHDPAYLLGI